MIVKVVVMGQLYGVEYLLADIWGCCSILAAFDRYCRNEDWNSIIPEGLLLYVCCLCSCPLLVPY